MRPLPTSPTNTFQSPKAATTAGLEAPSFSPDLGAAFGALVEAMAGGRRAAAAGSRGGGRRGRRGRGQNRLCGAQLLRHAPYRGQIPGEAQAAIFAQRRVLRPRGYAGTGSARV